MAAGKAGAEGEVLGLSGALAALPTAITIAVVLDITYRKQISDAISGISDSIIHAAGGSTSPGNGGAIPAMTDLQAQRLGFKNAADFYKQHGVTRANPVRASAGPARDRSSRPVRRSGGKNDVGLFINDLIAAFGGKQSAATKNVLAAWQRMEGGSTNNPDSFNFLNTTLKMPGSHGTGNVDGVQAYQSFKQGLDATIQTLNHGYPAIIEAIRTGNWAPTAELASELSKWSGGGYSSILASAGGGSAGPPGSTTLPNVSATSSAAKKPPRVQAAAVGSEGRH